MIFRFKSPDIRKHVKYILLLVWFFAVWTVNAQEMDSPQIIEEAIRHQNLGLAYLEESQPSKAVEAFTALIELLPTEAIGYGNLAVAHLRLQQADAAEEWVKRGIAVAPMDSQLHFILSEVYQLQGESELAVEAMKEAVRLAPDELEFRYKLVRHYIGQRNDPEAQQEMVRHLRELHARSPVNIVVLLKLTQGLLAQEKLKDAENLCQELMLLLGDIDPEKLKYLTQGITAIQQGDLKIAIRNMRIFENVQRASPRYQQGIGELVTDILGHPIETFSSGFKARIVAKQSTSMTVDFLDVTEQLGLGNVEGVPLRFTDVSLMDYDGDGDLDLYTTLTGMLFENTGEKFIAVQQVQEILEQQALQPHTAVLVDLNKDGVQEFLLQTREGITSLQMDVNGNWGTLPLVQLQKTIYETGLLLPVDYDHDGDLDLFSARTNLAMYRNNGIADAKGNLTFTDVSEQTFVATEEGDALVVRGAPIEALSADFDDDGDIDIFVTHEEMGCTLFDNLRQGRLRAISSETGIPQDVRYTAAAAGDYDNDGDFDLFLATADRLHLYRNRGDGSFIDAPNLEASALDLPVALLKNLDYDNDGVVDVWVSGQDGMFLFRNEGGGVFSEPYPLVGSITPTEGALLRNANAGTVGDYDNDGDLDLFFINTEGQLRVLQNDGGNQNNWIQVRLEGITAGNNKVNRDGIGSKLEVKVGDLYQLQYVTEQVSHFGLGAYDTADVVRVVWTNGVPQNVVTPQAKQRILEKQVLKGSCPFLYVYDGEDYQFITDLLWRAPLGLVTSMGFVAPDETKDFVKISGTQMQPKSGKYSIQITEELWETAYFDEVKLIAVDHPIGTDIFVNEQYTPPPFAAFKIYGVAEKRFPKSAVDHRGKDVSDALKAFDYGYAVEHAPGAYQGVVDPHAIVLDLGDVSNDTPLTLFLGGWIFPTDTSINVALFQNPAINPRFPSVAVKDKTGEWKTVIDMIGLPAGKNKTITVDLTGKFLSEDRRVRIETDMQIYWDTAFFTVGTQTVPMEVTTLNPDSADLHYRGFSEMYRPNPHAPHLFDYQKVTKAAQWRDLAGFYTRYGDVAPLLQEVDDMYVILNAGDEITVEFDASRLPTLKAGWVRDFILYSDGWDKDGDINTLTSQTVEPLPFHGMSAYPYPDDEHYPNDAAHRQYQLKYNTRRVEHRLPSLDDVIK
ncbi:VCBS repeat-containing protein [Candidatus Poribacteria bacterium]|nr:VCBS repeat-containing protein [Candidatus Poribacteria bacterium]